MANLTTVVYSAGALAGTVAGTVSTVDALLATGLPIAQGGNTAVVKAASTAALATDPALVVTLSPNNGAKLQDGSGNAVTSTANALDVNIKSGTGLNVNGQAAMANSSPMVLPNDQIIGMPTSSNLVQGVISSAMSGTTTTQLLAAPGVSLRNYVTQITVSNSSAVGTELLVQDGSGGTTMYVIPAAANFGGAVLSFNPPLRQPTTNNGLWVQNTVTSSGTKASASGFKAA